MENLNNISDPFLRDWATIIALCAIGFFVVIRWSITWISDIRQKALDRYDGQVSIVEEYLVDEVDRIRKENIKLTEENRAILTESIKTNNDLSRLQLKVRNLIYRIKYLENVLRRHHVNFTPAESDFDA